MNARLRLDRYLDDLRRRLRSLFLARAAAVGAVTTLVVTVVAVWLLNQRGFPSGAVLAARSILIAALLAAGVTLLWLPLRRLRVRKGATELERRLPSQQGRVETYLDATRRCGSEVDLPLLDLLAEDALRRAEASPPESVVSSRAIRTGATVALAAFGVLLLVLGLGPSYWGFGSRHVLLGLPLPSQYLAARRIEVQPGDVTVRRNQDLPIRASLHGMSADEAIVHVRFGESTDWESAPMQAARTGGFEFTLYALREPLSYYVTSGGARSAVHRVEVVDLPRIERMRLTYVYPEWTGLQPTVDESSRDIRAVAGTRVELEIQTSAPLDSPTLVVNGTQSGLRSQGTLTTGSFVLNEPGRYHVGAKVGGQLAPLTDEHDITLIADRKPTVEVVHPGRDWHASRIEEVPVRIRAGDDFQVQALELRYSINGGQWHSLPLDARSRQVSTEALLRLEDLGTEDPGSGPAAAGRSAGPGLQPGDIVSYYAVARDRGQEAQTDLYLIQVQPFDRRFMQSQAAGGGQGGMDDQPGSISDRQREILLATWNLQRSRDEPGSRGAQRLQDNARMLSELQSTLAEQASTLVTRARARLLATADEQIRAFVENLELAAQAMQPAAKHLRALELRQAIPAEQKALQHLLRAEAIFTDIQVAFANNGGGGWQAGRDLADMFELEMDLEKNQYETESRVSMETPSRELEEAIRKLRELARRQERLARDASRQSPAALQEQRWRQEQLRREAEDLRRRLAELAQREARNRQQSGGESSSGSQGQGSSGGQQGQSLSAERNDGGASGSSSGGSGSTSGSQGQSQGQPLNAGRNDGGASGSSGGEEESASGTQPRTAQSGTGNDRDASGRGAASEALEQIENAIRNMNVASGAQPGEAGGAGSGTHPAQEAERSLRQALERIERERHEGLVGAFDELARRAQRLLDEQRRSETELLEALTGETRPEGSRVLREDRLSPQQARALAERKREMQRELRALERDMRAAVQRHGRDAPDASERLDEAVTELSRSGTGSRLARSAIDLERGRATDAATRDGLITEALEALEQQLGQTARVAASEAGQRGRGTEPGEVTAEELLAELGELRRALEQASGGAAGGGGEGIGPTSAFQNGQPSHLFQGGRAGPWSPPSARDALRGVDSPELRERAAAIGERLQELVNRLPRGALPSTDVEALQRLAQQLQLGARGDPMQSYYAQMVDAVDQLELAALDAVGPARAASPTRTTPPEADSPQYRESVAEYYRRLGDGR